MNSQQLLAALQEAGVDGRTYGVCGQIPGGRLIDGSGFLNQEADGRWFLGSYERGVYTMERYFDSEDEACQYLYDMLTRPRPEPVRLTPEEEAAAKEINRQAAAEDRRQIAEAKARYEQEHGRPNSNGHG
ncbi:hypothetical protein [Kitasatospora sp. McL0602]|uniref:hypothetical protein n=1 Tax=Kitasatospora sp. McL0602 TaxID=3439530 RepID=UPI003F89F113